MLPVWRIEPKRLIIAAVPMTLRRKIGLSTALLLTVAFLAALVFPLSNGDTRKVHDSFVRLKKPFSKIETEYYLDGGSIGLRIVDANGTANEFALPVSFKATERDYTNLVIGTMWLSRTNRHESFPLNKETKGFICYCIERETKPNGMSHIALLYLRGAPRDYVRLFAWCVADRIRNEW